MDTPRNVPEYPRTCKAIRRESTCHSRCLARRLLDWLAQSIHLNLARRTGPRSLAVTMKGTRGDNEDVPRSRKSQLGTRAIHEGIRELARALGAVGYYGSLCEA